MEGQLATGFVPYEIKDSVKLKKGDTIWEVVEIRFTQYIAAKKAEIHLQLFDKDKGKKVWRKADKIERRIIA